MGLMDRVKEQAAQVAQQRSHAPQRDMQLVVPASSHRYERADRLGRQLIRAQLLFQQPRAQMSHQVRVLRHDPPRVSLCGQLRPEALRVRR